MKWFIALMVFMFSSMIFSIYMLIVVPPYKDITKELQEEKTRLEIQKLKYELSVYKEMEESGK